MPDATAYAPNLGAYFKLDGTRAITGRTTAAYTLAGAASARYGIDHTIAVTGTDTQTIGGLRIQQTIASGQAASELRGLYSSLLVAGDAEYSYGNLSTVNHTAATATSEAYGYYAIVGHSGAGLLGFNSGYSGFLTASGPTTTNAGLYFETFNSAANGTTYGLYTTSSNTSTMSGTLYGAFISATQSGTAANLIGLDVTVTGTGTTKTRAIRATGNIELTGVFNRLDTNEYEFSFGRNATYTASQLKVVNATTAGRGFVIAGNTTGSVINFLSEAGTTLTGIQASSVSTGALSASGLPALAITGSGNGITFTDFGTTGIALTIQNKVHTYADASNFVFGSTTGQKIGTAATQKLAFYGQSPIVRPVLATGAGATVDNVITALQNLGLVGQT